MPSMGASESPAAPNPAGRSYPEYVDTGQMSENSRLAAPDTVLILAIENGFSETSRLAAPRAGCRLAVGPHVWLPARSALRLYGTGCRDFPARSRGLADAGPVAVPVHSDGPITSGAAPAFLRRAIRAFAVSWTRGGLACGGPTPVSATIDPDQIQGLGRIFLGCGAAESGRSHFNSRA